MHVISRDAKRRLVVDHPATTSSLPPQNPQQPVLILFLPEILFQIGTLLDKPDLRSCALVCSTWHPIFSPFLDWIALGRFGEYMKKTKHCCQIGYCQCASGYSDRWCPQGSKFLIALFQRVTKPDATFGMHNSRNSDLSFDRLEYNAPHDDSPTPKSTRTLRIDSICLLAEKSKDMKHLALNMRQNLDVKPAHQCLWTKSLQRKTEIEISEERENGSSNMAQVGSGLCLPATLHLVKSPNWPSLIDVTLQNCYLEHSFLRVLMRNAPVLENIDLIYVSFSKPEPREPASSFPVQQTDIKVQPEEGAQEQTRTTADKKEWASRLTSLSLWHVKGLQLQEVLQFASRLPTLHGFKCCLEDSAMPSPAMSSDQESLSGLGGFKSLDRLSLQDSPCKDTTAVFKSAQDGFSYFTLLDSPMNEPLVQALVGASHPEFLRTIELINIDLVDCDHAYNTMLCSLTCLESFCVRGGVMVCDPTVLAQAKWVCSDLKQLIVKPKCDGGGQRYSAQESQDAFLAQVASLGNVSHFDFEAGDEKDDTYGFAPEKSLEIIGTIPVPKNSYRSYREINLGAKTYRRMTAEHVDQIMTWQPGWEFYGVPVTEDVAFVQCMKMKKQFEQLRRYH